MTQTDIATQVTDVAALVHDGHIDQAKRQMRRALTHADPHALDVIARCVAILETVPLSIAVPKLRHYWKVCGSPADRAIIAACAPDPSCQRPDTPTVPAPRYPHHQVARDIRTEIRPELRRRPDQAQAQARRRAHRLAEDYAAHRADVDDEPTQQERPDGYAIDYDRAALPALRGLPCVRCWIERSAADRAGHHDDGLCTDCRERGRPGIPDGHADAVAARCEFIATHNGPQLAHRILRREWTRAGTDQHRAAITSWVHAHPEAVQAADAGPPHTAGACVGCGGYRAVRDSRCADCAAAQAADAL